MDPHSFFGITSLSFVFSILPFQHVSHGHVAKCNKTPTNSNYSCSPFSSAMKGHYTGPSSTIFIPTVQGQPARTEQQKAGVKE